MENHFNFPIGIGRMAEASGCSAETIRYFEQRGLIPAAGRTLGGHRLYDPEHLRMLRFILKGRALGFSQQDIRQLSDLVDPEKTNCAQAKEIAGHKLSEVRSRLRDLRRMEKTLKELVHECEVSDSRSHCPLIEALLGEEQN
jgi:MerR family mercuric resistance operon transcriptional regulator